MSVTALMLKHGIRQIVLVPKSELLSRNEFHAWPFDQYRECGVGRTAEEAIGDAVGRGLARAA